MQRRTALLLALVALAMGIAALLPLAAGAAVPNSACLGCHGVSSLWHENFDVGAVDKNTACRKCHLDRFAGTHPYHHGGGVCTTCHTSYGPSLVANVPSGAYAYGAFASPESGDTTSSILHIIHTNPRWPAGVDTTNSRCASCHGVASCDACHEGAVDATHGQHGEASSTIVPWVGNMSPGVVAGNDTVNTMLYGRSVYCGAAGCHDITGTANRRPIFYEDRTSPAYPADGYPYPTSIETSAAWKLSTGGVYTKGTESASNVTNNRLQLKFTGQRVVLVGTRDPYRGVMEIFLDGVSQGVVDQYNPTTANQQVFFDSGYVTSGQHSIQVRVTGTRNANARAAYVSIDQFRVYSATVGSIAPKCEYCHDSSHAGGAGGGSFSHDATQTITGSNYYNTGYGNYACNQCHVTKMVDEHKRTSAAGPKSCATCHTTYAQYEWSNTWAPADGCNFASCHPTSSPREPHAGDTADHASASVRADNACRDCHNADLRNAHTNQYPGNGYAEGKCLTCHGTTTLASGTSCTGSGCHTVSGVTSLSNHGYDAAKHTPTTFTRAAQGTGADGTVADGGYECNQCHSAAALPAHSGASPAVSCDSGGAGGNGCHLDTGLNSMATAKAGWPTEKCTDCHDYGAARTHDATSSAHLVASNGCAGSGAGCHNSNDLWQLHAVAQNGGVKKYNSCFDVDGTDPTGCHNVSDRRPTVNVANACGSTSTGCHRDINIAAHPSNYSHAFTTTSYYSAGTNTGCTNQLGCHDAGGNSTADFGKVFHAASGCSAGACHQSASKPAFTGLLPTDCQECHGGAFSGAPARSNLASDPAAGGHYDFTYHTATGTSMGTTITTGGSAGATCNNCHSPTVGGAAYGLLAQHTSVVIAGSPYGTSVTCGECHGDTRSYGAYEASQSVNWTNNKCEDCHKAGGSSVFDHAASAPAVNGTSAASCGATGSNCHGSYDLHTLHKNASGGCNLTGCHVYTQQSQRPSEKRCGEAGGCHAAYTVNTHAHASDAGKHQPTALTQANDTSFASTACGACHDIRNSNSSLTLEHALATSVKSTDAANNCRNCHNNAASTTAVGNNWSAKDTTSACTACHTAGLAIHANPNSSAHSDVTSGGCGNSGTGCHNTNDLSQVGATNAVNTNIHADCLTCHDRTASGGNLAYDPTKDTCGSGRECHGVGTQYNTTSFVHNGAGGLADGNDATHHQSLIARTNYTGADLVYDGGKECSTCHTDRLSSSHTTTTVGSVTCAGCHNSAVLTSSDDVVKASWPTKKCTACHTIASVHTAYQTSGGLQASHQATTTQGCMNTGAGCHGSSNDLGVIHATAGCNAGNGTSNTTCHNGDKKMNTVGKSCGSGGTCHTAYTAANHNGISTGDELASHQTTLTGFASDITAGAWTAAGNTCLNCHSRTLATAHKETSTTAALKSANTAWGSTAQSICLDCHNTSSPDNSTMVIKTDNWSARTCQQCHDTGGSNRGNGFHANYTTTEHTATVGTVGTADGCGDAGCHTAAATRDVRAIHNRVTSGCTASGTDSKGWSGGCHALDKQMTGTALSCGQGGAGQNCHASHTNSNHGSANAHTFTTASNYNGATESGCTNSGNGCHGTESTFGNYASSYHPTSGCTTGPCHTSANKFNTDTGHECAECHAGAYANAPDRVNLKDPYPSGHYNETTHTASGTNMTVSITSTGTASATCNNCHSATIGGLANGLLNQHSNSTVAGSTYGGAVGCSECHNDSRTYGAIEATEPANWTSNKCEDCHKVGGTSPFNHATRAPVVTGSSAKSCGGTGVNCHTTYDLHELHKDASGGCNLTGCHVYTQQANKPTEKRCGETGGCHATYTVDQAFTTHTNGVSQETTAHAPTNTTQETATWSVGGTTYQCGVCHIVSKTDGGLSAEHTLTTSARTTNGTNNCLNCHNNAASTTAVSGDWAAKNSNTACAACHTGSLAIHANENTAAHTTANAGCSTAGTTPGCHNTQDLSSTGSTATAANTVIHNSCARCHDHNGGASWSNALIGTGSGVKYNPSVKTCGGATGCHTSTYYSSTTYQHRVGRADVVSGTDALHTASGMASTITSGVATAACSACHSTALASAHTTATITNNLGSGHSAWSATTCLPCHNATVAPTANAATQVKGNWTNNLCSDCHATYHNTFSSGHTGTSTQSCGASGAGCHNTYDLAALHGKTKTNGCQLSGCHDSVNKGMGSAAKSCGSGGTCHNTYTATSHGTATGLETTHTASAASMAVKVDGTTYDTGGGNLCSSCHSSTLRSSHTTVAASLESGNASWTTPFCANCHNTTTPDNSPAVIKEAPTAWSTQTCDQCHVTNGNGKHATYTLAEHTSAKGSGCTQGSCHGGVTDVRTLHNKAGAGCTAKGTDSMGWTGGCHDLDKQMTTTALSCGSGSAGQACHTNHTSSNHGMVDHNGNLPVGTAAGTTGQTYNYGTNVGCFGCHAADLTVEHGPTSISTTTAVGMNRTKEGGTGGTDGCGTCHTDKGTPGTYASATAVQSAIANGDFRCVSCHNQSADNASGVQKPHMNAYNATAGSDGNKMPTGMTTAPLGTTWEFQNWTPVTGYKGGGHNSVAGLGYPGPGTWSGTFQTGWSTTSAVLCSDCHTYSTGGPQGASVTYDIVAPYASTKGAWFNGTTPYVWPTGDSSSGGFGGAGQPVVPGLCAKCHKTIAGPFHGGNGGHDSASTSAIGGKACINCHLRIPHAWSRPRLLRRVAGGNQGSPTAQPQDTAPYALPSTSPGVISFTNAGITGSSNCNENLCAHHSQTGSYYP